MFIKVAFRVWETFSLGFINEFLKHVFKIVLKLNNRT